jgi:N utilization substance protein B
MSEESEETPPPRKSRRGKSGSAGRSAARLAAVQALYQADMTGLAGGIITNEFVRHRLGHEIDGDAYGPADETLFRFVVEGTLSREQELDTLIGETLTPEWKVARLETVLRAILRAATFELAGNIEVPARVVMSEYVDIAHAFFAGKETGLVNGVLDRLAHRLRAAELA